MTRRAVLVCPGRGSYNRGELGYLARHHAARGDLIARFDAIRAGSGAETVSALDGAASFTLSKYGRGDVASALIYACAVADAEALAEDIEVVAVTGNSMGWYIALAAGGALGLEEGFRLTDTMGRLMTEHGAGGQIVYPVTGADWAPDEARRARVSDLIARIDGRAGNRLALSIDLGGAWVIAGDEAGLTAFEAEAEPMPGGFPMRLAGHAAFHTDLVAQVGAMGREAFGPAQFGQPRVPLIDGRGAIWWPHATDTGALWDYTLGHQVEKPYDFSAAIRVAAREFAPDLFILTGPGASLGAPVIQSLIGCGWRGMSDRAGFEAVQADAPLVAAMGRPEQRAWVAAD